MFLIHGTGWNAGRLIMTAMRDGAALKEHNVVWQDNSQRDRMYFWTAPGVFYGDSVGVDRELVVRAGEAAMYTKAIAGKTDKRVCILTLWADETAGTFVTDDSDAGGKLPSGYIAVGDFNKCVKEGHIKLVTAVYDKIYQPELRWEYLASMMLHGRRFYIDDPNDDLLMKAAAKIRSGQDRGDVEDFAGFHRLFGKPLLEADWKLMV